MTESVVAGAATKLARRPATVSPRPAGRAKPGPQMSIRARSREALAPVANRSYGHRSSLRAPPDIERPEDRPLWHSTHVRTSTPAPQMGSTATESPRPDRLRLLCRFPQAPRRSTKPDTPGLVTGARYVSPGPSSSTARQVPFERSHHGDTVPDEFAWLADKDNPDTLAYLEAENAWTGSATEHLADLRTTVLRGDKGPNAGDGSVGAEPQRRPLVLRPTEEGKQYGIHCRMPRAARRDRPTGPPGCPPRDREPVLMTWNEVQFSR